MKRWIKNKTEGVEVESCHDVIQKYDYSSRKNNQILLDSGKWL